MTFNQSLRRASLALGLGLLALGGQRAAAAEGQFYLSPGLQWIESSNSMNRAADTGLTLGVGYDFTDRLSGEVNYFNLSPKFKRGGGEMDFDQWRADVVYDLNARLGAFDTFVATGLGHNEFSADEETVWDLGVGVVYKINDVISWRTAVRHFLSFDRSKSDIGVDTGFVLRFGERPAPVVAAPAPAPAPTPAPTPPPAPRQEVARIDLLVNFDFDRSVVKPEYMDEIEQLANFMRQYPDVVAELEGHTDSVGTDAYNQGLSERRANAVRQVLIDRFNIPAARISTVGFGESRPVATNDTDAGRAQNRRVITVILKTITN